MTFSADPLVSIGMPVRNCEHTVAAAIRSILGQTYRHWELLIIDDGSVDRTLEIACSFEEARIRIVGDGFHSGLPARLNQAVRLSRGKYFARMDGDDVSFPERLLRQVAYLEDHPGTDLLATSVLVFRGDGVVLGERRCPASHDEICCRPWGSFPMPHPTWMGRTEWFRRHPYDVRAVRAEDQELLLRTHDYSRFAGLQEILLGYREERLRLASISRGRMSYVTAGLRYFLCRRELGYALALACGHSFRMLGDVVAIASGLEHRLLRHRARPITGLLRRGWEMVWALNHAHRLQIGSNSARLLRAGPRIQVLSSSKTISVAHVIARLNVGGAAVQVILATKALRERQHRALLVCGELSASEGSMDHVAEAHGIPLTKVPGLRRDCGFNDVLALARLVRLFRRERPDIVHTHTAKAGTLGRIAALLAGVPVRVHTFHGNVFDGYFSWPLSWAIRFTERLLGRFTNCLIAVSESQRRQLAEIYRIAPAAKILSIPLGLEMEHLLRIEGREGRLRAELGCAPGEVLVGWVGRFAAVKAPELLLECARTSSVCRFVMVGDGELRADCERRIHDLGLESRLTLLGWRRELAGIYADLDVVTLTSKNEGTPVALLEAMAAGRPFVATDVGGVRDLVVGTPRHKDGFEEFDNGILVPSGNARTLAAAVRHLAVNANLRRAMGRKGREFVESCFSPDRLAGDLERLYRDLLAKKYRPQERRLAGQGRTLTS